MDFTQTQEVVLSTVSYVSYEQLRIISTSSEGRLTQENLLASGKTGSELCKSPPRQKLVGTRALKRREASRKEIVRPKRRRKRALT